MGNYIGIHKIICIIVLLTMIISIVPVYAEDVNYPTLRVSSATLYRGESANINVTLENIETIAGIQLYLKYDVNKFVVASKDDIKVNPELSSLNISVALTDKGIIRLTSYTSNNIEISSPINVITVKMTAKADAPFEKFDLTLTDSYLGINNEGGQYVENLQLVNGSITVRSTSSGSTPTTPPSTPPPSTPPPSTPPITPGATPSVAEVKITSTFTLGKATSTVSEADAKKAIDAAIKAAQDNKTTSEVKINVAGTETANSVETSMKKNTITELKNKNVDYLTISSSIGNVTFDKKAITMISDNAGNDVVLTIERIDNTTLSEEVQALVGDRPVYDIYLVSNGKRITDFKDGSIKIAVPYTLKDGEKANNIAIYQLTDTDTLQKINNTAYDQTQKAVVFNTNVFAKYVIAYDAPKIVFTDVSGWAEEYVYFLAEKGILLGKAEGIFAPNDNVTRAEFVAIIARSVGFDENDSVQTDFTDVNAADWFAPYVAWANENEIILGYEDGSFAPNKQITREELCTIIVRTLTAFGAEFEKADLNFADADITSNWAKDSIATLANLGIIAGKGGNLFAPQDFATRAETAKIVAGFYQILFEN